MALEQINEICDRGFATHKATLIQNTDRYLIIDWRRADGSIEYYVNYIVDKKRGSLIVSGDLGDSIATWYNVIDPAKLKLWIKNDIGYYIDKMQCSSHWYDYEVENIVADIKYYLKDCNVFDVLDAYNQFFSGYPDTPEEMWESFADDIEGCIRGNKFIPPEELEYFCEEFDADYQEWLYDCGKRINSRVYLWADGFYKACNQLGI